MSDMDFHHDDVALKHAVKRVWGQEVAPLSLRESVGRLICGEFHPVSFLARRNPLYGVAAAAVVLLAVGLFAYTGQVLLTMPSTVAFAHPVTTSIAVELVEQHDRNRHVPKNFQSLKGDFEVVARRLKFLSGGRPTLARDLPDGWRFRGAGLAEVAGLKVPQLVFTRGRQTLSMFSMPPLILSHEADPEGNFQCLYEKHIVAGFVTPDAFYCLVGYDLDGRLMPDAVMGLRDQLRADMPPSAGEAPNSRPAQN